MKNILVVMLSLAAIVACQQIPVNSESRDKILLNQTYQDSAGALFRARGLTASQLAIDTALTGSYYADKLENYSPTAEAELRAQLAAYQQQLVNYSNPLSTDEDINRKVVASIVRYYAGHPDFDIGYIDSWMGLSAFIVNQINGPAIDAPSLLQNNHQLKNLKDAQDYVARLQGFKAMLAGVGSKATLDAQNGWVAPQLIIAKAIKNLDGFTESAPTEHPLYVNLETSLADLDDLTADEKTALLADAADAMSNSVYPGYQTLSQTMQALLPQGRKEHGIWAQPNGAKFYEDAIANLGDTDMSADQIHDLGLSEVERISKEMDAILKDEGYLEGTVGERMDALNKEARFLYPDTDAGRQELLADLNQHVQNIDAKMDTMFATRPKFDVEIRRIPVEREVGAPGGQYTSPSLDGVTPGIYWINLHDITANPRFDLETLTYHEANPGHHWQIALNLQQDSLPMLRRIAPYNAYVEGWALYSEQVAVELGMYENDPYNNLGRLKAELFRAVRLVVDTGLHHKRWTREQAIEYMASTTGAAPSDVVSEIERYMVWPGQALGYKLGMITIQQARADAERQLGEKFDIKEFHDVVLLGGAMPMSILKENINNWIASKQ